MSVFANTREISGKATPNKTIAAFPDVCLSPPSPPAGPIPIPYPLTGIASDTTDGTSSVYIRGKEVGKKNGVKYSKVDGNQPATNSFGANIISHKITGPLKFAAYSFDVMIEKGGAERFMDLTTQNHVNVGGGSGGVDTAGIAQPPPPPDPDCAALRVETDGMRQAVREGAEAAFREQGPAWTDKQQKFFNDQINKRLHGALTACQVPGGPVSRYTSNGLNREAVQQRGMSVENQPAVTDTSSTVCGKNKKYKKAEHKYHTESQLLESIDWGSPPGSITFSTDWPAMTNGRLDPERVDGPCEHCEKKLVEACMCGLKIYICDGDKRTDYCAANGVGQ